MKRQKLRDYICRPTAAASSARRNGTGEGKKRMKDEGGRMI